MSENAQLKAVSYQRSVIRRMNLNEIHISDGMKVNLIIESDDEESVDEILNLPHNGHTIIAWSMNNELVTFKSVDMK